MSTEAIHFKNEIAVPVAGERLERKLLRMTKRCLVYKGVRRGVKEVCKSIRRDMTGIVLLAADVTPIDVYSHIPLLCETHKIPYIYVSNRTELGLAAGTKRPTSVILVKDPPADFDNNDAFYKIKNRLQSLEENGDD